MNDAHESGTTACGGPLQHLEITVRISERENRAPSNVQVDADRLAGAIIDEAQFRKTHQAGFVRLQFEFRFDAAAHHLFGWYTVNIFHPWTHELVASTRDDEGLEAVRTKVRHQLDHRCVD